jgi:hypothetical protein
MLRESLLCVLCALLAIPPAKHNKNTTKNNMNTKRNRWTRADRIARFYRVFSDLGLSFDETETLRRAEMTLHRWHELECGNCNAYGTTYCLTRDEGTGKPFMEYHPQDGKTLRTAYPDKEKGALRRIAAVLAGKENIAGYYQQTDPRGCALYILRKGDVPEGERAESYYSRGIAVCY